MFASKTMIRITFTAKYVLVVNNKDAGIDIMTEWLIVVGFCFLKETVHADYSWFSDDVTTSFIIERPPCWCPIEARSTIHCYTTLTFSLELFDINIDLSQK